MAQNDNITEDPMALTCAYRREASEIAASLGGSSSIVSSLEKCLGRNALADATKESASLDIPSSFLFCHACGAMLQPGTNGTTLRLRAVGRGNTRRRRASRKRAREFQRRKQQQSGGRKFQQHENNEYRKEERDFMNVTDGACRNAVVVTCGSCGWKLKYKGMPPVKTQTKNVKVEDPKKSFARPSPKKDLGDGDLISLPRSCAGGRTEKANKRKRARAISDSRKQKSGLQDFLSSLND